jgi:hypothetical protein
LSRAIDGADQPAQGEIEVPLGQAVQVQLWQHPADFLGPALEGRQQPALKTLAQPAHPRPAEPDRPIAQAQPPRLAEPIAITGARIDGITPLVPPTAEHAVHLFLQHLLQELLHALPGEGLQRLPGRA